MTTHLFPNPLPKRPSGAPDAGFPHRSIPRGAGSVRASVLASASRSSRHFSPAGPTPAPTRPDLSGSVATSDIAHLGGPIRVQHDIQPGAIDTGVTAIVALRLDADRPSWVEATSHGWEVASQGT